MESVTNAMLHATVLKVEHCALCVCDHCKSQEIMVHYPKAHCFCPGDEVCITYSGAMTMSIPPQITATCITKVPRCGC